MDIKFQSKEDVYKFLRHGGDAWGTPIVEDYLDRHYSLEDKLDTEKLNEHVETELNSFQKEYEEFLDDR